MSRQTLPLPSRNEAGRAFFPSFQKEMNRLFDQFRSGFPSMDDDANLIFSGAAFPAIDVVETDDAVTISAEVPGVAEDDLDVTITGQTLVLKGEKSADHVEDEDSFHLIERRYGSFRRQIPLGFAPDQGAVGVKFEDGILKLTVPKPPTAKDDVQKVAIKKS